MGFTTEVTGKLDDSAGSRHKEDIGAKCLQVHWYDYGISVLLKRLVCVCVCVSASGGLKTLAKL